MDVNMPSNNGVTHSPQTQDNLTAVKNKEMHFAFPKFKHEQHGPIINVNKKVDEKLTLGARVSDAVAATVGSWRFIIIQSIILLLWIILNIIGWIHSWDPYPFILLNLALSFQAAFAAPFVMMSQNRQAVKDRLTAENDYKTDVKGEQEISHIMEHLDHQDSLILQIVQHLEGQNTTIAQEESQTLQIVEQLQQQGELLKKQDALILEIVHRLEEDHQQLYEQREELMKRIAQLVPPEDKSAFDMSNYHTDEAGTQNS